jgi:hypothetical protein
MPTLDGSDAEAQFTSDALPPDGGYGWVCTACTFTINCFSWGMVSVSSSKASVSLLKDFFGLRRQQ